MSCENIEVLWPPKIDQRALSSTCIQVSRKHTNVGSVHGTAAGRRGETGDLNSRHVSAIPGTCVQYPGLQGGDALGDASTPGTPAGSIAASAHKGSYSLVAAAGGAWGGERGTAAATAAAAARRHGATPTGGAVTPPHSAAARGGWGGRHGARAGRWDRPLRDRAPLSAPVDGVSN